MGAFYTRKPIGIQKELDLGIKEHRVGKPCAREAQLDITPCIAKL
jgi:hypothetical protein